MSLQLALPLCIINHTKSMLRTTASSSPTDHVSMVVSTYPPSRKFAANKAQTASSPRHPRNLRGNCQGFILPQARGEIRMPRALRIAVAHAASCNTQSAAEGYKYSLSCAGLCRRGYVRWPREIGEDSQSDGLALCVYVRMC